MIAIKKTIRGTYPHVPFKVLADAILGSHYDLSIAIIGTARSRSLNAEHRGKKKPANVLSFPLEKDAGEIVLCPKIAKRQAPDFNMSYRVYFGFLFIHGCLHLEGYRHGSTMERREQELVDRFLKR